MDNPEPSSTQSVEFGQAGRGSDDGLLEPLIQKILEISRRLDELQRLVEMKSEEIERLYQAACLVTRAKAAVLLDLSQSQLDRRTKKKELLNVGLDRRPRYALTDLIALINARRGISPKRQSGLKADEARSTADEMHKTLNSISGPSRSSGRRKPHRSAQ